MEKLTKEKVVFSKHDESLKIGVEKIDREKIENISVLDDNHLCEQIIKSEISTLAIAPHHIRDYEIKKPEEKEPSLLKMISDKLKGNTNPNKQKCKGSDENLSKEKTLSS